MIASAYTELQKLGCAVTTRQVRVRCEGGILKPLEELGLDDGEELVINVPDKRRGYDVAAMQAAFGGWSHRGDLDELIEELQEARRIGSRTPPTP